MYFGVEVAGDLGYLHVEFREGPSRDKIYTGQNMQNLPRAVDLASPNIFKKFLFWQKPWVHTYKSCSYRFFPYATFESENWKMWFLGFWKIWTFPPFFSKFLVTTDQNNASWPGFGSIPTTTAIFVQIGVGRITPGPYLGDSFLHALLNVSNDTETVSVSMSPSQNFWIGFNQRL